MSVWKKLITAVRGGANEAAEAVADNQALRILDQEIRDAKEELRKSDHSRTTIIAKRKLAQGKVSDLQKKVDEYEGHARKAMDKGNQELALECAAKVSDVRIQMESEQQVVDQFLASEGTLKTNIDGAKKNLAKMERQVDIVKATASVQKAQTAVSSQHLGANSRMKTAAESLGRIQDRQKQTAAELEAANELASEEAGDDLEQKLREAGISGASSSADDELARIMGGSQS